MCVCVSFVGSRNLIRPTQTFSSLIFPMHPIFISKHNLTNILIAHLNDITIFYIKVSHNVQSEHVCWCNKKVIVWLCVCTGDNPLAKARVLSFRTHAKTIQ